MEEGAGARLPQAVLHVDFTSPVPLWDGLSIHKRAFQGYKCPGLRGHVMPMAASLAGEDIAQKKSMLLCSFSSGVVGMGIKALAARAASS